MSKAILYGVNTNAQTVIVGDRINFGSIVRRYGKNINMSGGEVLLNGEGYYSIESSVTVVAGAAGIVTVTLLKDGSVIPGAGASATVADGNTITLNLPSCAVRQKCCCESTISAVITGVIGQVVNTTILVEKE